MKIARAKSPNSRGRVGTPRKRWWDIYKTEETNIEETHLRSQKIRRKKKIIAIELIYCSGNCHQKENKTENVCQLRKFKTICHQ